MCSLALAGQLESGGEGARSLASERQLFSPSQGAGECCNHCMCRLQQGSRTLQRPLPPACSARQWEGAASEFTPLCWHARWRPHQWLPPAPLPSGPFQLPPASPAFRLANESSSHMAPSKLLLFCWVLG